MSAQVHITPYEHGPFFRGAAAMLAARGLLCLFRLLWQNQSNADLHDLLVHLQGLQVHIAPYAACEGLFRGAAAALPPGGPLCLYGPFLRGQGDAPSNIGFDRMLRRHDPAWGVRELARVRATAGKCGLEMHEAVDMPSNNLLLVFKQRTADA